MADVVGGPKKPRQPIFIRHLLATRPYLRSEAGGSLDNISHNASSFSPPSFRSNSLSLEEEMASSVENLFRDWDSGGGRRRNRPFRSLPREGASQRVRSESGPQGLGFDSGDEWLEEPSVRRPLYVDCADTGRRHFRMEFDAEGFGKESLSVTLSGSKLEVRAVQEETEEGRKSTSEFCRRIRLPSDVDGKKMTCSLVDGKILIEAPTLDVHSPPVGAVLPSPASPSLPALGALNVPLIRSQNGCRVLTLTVEVGRIFRSDDVTVTLKNPAKVVVKAERSEVTEGSRMRANLLREFDLPVKVIPRTLKAGMTPDGLLKIEAGLVQDAEGGDMNSR